MEDCVQMEVTSLGIKFFIQNNFYLNRDLAAALQKTIIENNLSKKFTYNNFEGSDKTLFQIISKGIEEKLQVQLCFLYNSGIKSLEVKDGSFVLNGNTFVLSR